MSDESERRKLLVQRALEARRIQQEKNVERNDDSSDSSSDSEETSSSSSSESVVRIKFVKKGDRATMIERERKEAEMEEQKAREKFEEELFLKQQRERVVADAIREEEMIDADDSTDVLRPPPIGDEDTEEAYQRWKIRELKRILRYRGLIEEEGEDGDESEAAEEPETDQVDTRTEKEKIQSATAKMKASLFKQAMSLQDVDATGTPETGQAPPQSERAKLGIKFAQKSGGMRDI